SLRDAPIPQRSALDAVAISPRLPRALQGAPDAFGLASLDQLKRPRTREAFEGMYEPDPALELLARKLGKDAPPAAVQYPGGPIGNSLKQLAQLIKADVGLRVGCADAGGWDTHAAQPGQLANNLKQLAESLSAFRRDLGPRAEDAVLVAATEFGRTVRQN